MVFFILLEYVCFEVIFKVLPFIRQEIWNAPCYIAHSPSLTWVFCLNCKVFVGIKMKGLAQIKNWSNAGSNSPLYMGLHGGQCLCLVSPRWGNECQNFSFYIRIHCHQFLVFPQCGSDREKYLSCNTCRHLGLMPRRGRPPTSTHPHSSLERQEQGSVWPISCCSQGDHSKARESSFITEKVIWFAKYFNCVDVISLSILN